MTDSRPGLLVPSAGARRIPTLAALCDEYRLADGPADLGPDGAVLAWGRKPSAARAAALARRLGRPLVFAEDGFLRSHGTGDRFAPLSLTLDSRGVYYDATAPSDLEALLESPADLSAGPGALADRARELVAAHRLSKYNHAPDLPETGLPGPARGRRVLVVDQTAGDLSVGLGLAGPDSFGDLLRTALDENPGATVYVKTHPEVSAGRKAGYLTGVRDGDRVVVLRRPVNPADLVRRMDRVYVVSSTLGFEALLAGVPVTCLGLPWYAGWGATDDRQSCPRRSRRRGVAELFAAAYCHHARYLDPETGRRGTILDVIAWLVRQRRLAAGQGGRVICLGFRRWKAHNLRPMLSLDPSRVVFAPDADRAAALSPPPGPDDRLVVWGRDVPEAASALAARSGAGIGRLEDGFLRSVGLGSDFIRPLSLVLDARGLYFDPTAPSDLEEILNTAVFSDDELAQAREARRLVVEHGLTKYNIEPRRRPDWDTGGRPVVLVPGQVEDDASIRFGCREVRTNLDLLRAARAARPGAFLVYKPHPDVLSGNRAGRLALSRALETADAVATGVSVVSCLEACGEVHTMTSLAGFDALVRGKGVVTYGQPFYAGWGLTEDRSGGGGALARRRRRLSLDELVAGVLVRYPFYWDWELSGYTTCLAVARRLAAVRDGLEASGGLERLRVGYFGRRWRKLQILVRALLRRP